MSQENPVPGAPVPPPADPNAYLGLPAERAERQAADDGWTTVRRLAPDAVITMEYLVGRLNLVVDGGTVTRCWEG